jgi:N-acetylmuramoyl-L-alanine amidase
MARLRTAPARRAPLALLAALAACVAPAGPIEPDPYEAPAPAEAAARVGSEIVICGRRVDIGAPVVLWSDPGGYDGYAPVGGELTYHPGRKARPEAGAPEVDPACDDPRELAGVDQFVVHYDVCGTSRTCFRVLHDRGLSVHFLLDVDGTLYQTLDLRETAWHATRSNTRSVGVEIAHIGARTRAEAGALDEWYAEDARGLRLTLPERFGDGGVRTPGFVGRPAREGLFEGTINGSTLVQYDFTPEQYATLERLLAVLVRELPAMDGRLPRDASGEVAADVLDDDAWQRFSGVLGHWHVQRNKTDPGPAMDWDRLSRAIGER